MTAETLEEKAARLLRAGEVEIHQLIADRVIATVRGDSGVWEVRHERGGWRCECPCRGRCSHLQAVASVMPSRLRRRLGVPA